MNSIEQLKRRLDGLTPSPQEETNQVATMSDADVERIAREIIAKGIPEDASPEYRALYEQVRATIERRDRAAEAAHAND